MFSKHTHPHGNPWQLPFRQRFEVGLNEVFNSHSSQSIDAGGHSTTEGKIYTNFYVSKTEIIDNKLATGTEKLPLSRTVAED